MTAVIGESTHDTSLFHEMIANPSIQSHNNRSHSHPHPHATSPYRIPSTSRTRQPSSTRSNRSPASAAATSPSIRDARQRRLADSPRGPPSAARIPSPPSSSPIVASDPQVDNANGVSMASEMITTQAATSHAPSDAPASSSSSHHLQQPSPASDDFRINTAADAPPALPKPTVVHVQNLAHLRNLAVETNMLSGGSSSGMNDASTEQIKYDISGMPIGDVIEMVAALLTKITNTNDLQHDAMQRNVAHQQQANQSSDASGSHINPMSHSVLAFHGKNVPAITILSYLSRIHKYCPTTFEVFLSLLVYFDRMTERVNDMVTKSEEARKASVSTATVAMGQTDTAMRDTQAAEAGDESDSDLADDDDDDEMEDSTRKNPKVISHPDELPSLNGPATYFVVDSFNIHRLIISGVTCSSKFFSDVFYTNSRYAKVGGLPLAELNHLELQFLILNDFRLAIPVEDLEAYATMLVEFYAREVLSRA